MPTGYTHAVATGDVADLETFALHLARGMGALIMMRDEPSNAPIPERFEPSSYNAEKLAEAKAERARLYAMSDADAQAEADREFAEQSKARDDYIADKHTQRDRYLAMIAKVEAWEGAPEGVKEFGLEQLRQSIDFDCREPFKYYREVVQQTGAEWKRAALEKIARDVEYHAAEDAKERERMAARNAWVDQLRLSLAGPTGKDL